MNKYKVIYEKYERYESGAIQVATFEASSDIQALANIMEECMYGVELTKNTTLEELQESIYRCNGDGCDFIFKVENLSSGDTLIEQGDAFAERDWGELDDVEYVE